MSKPRRISDVERTATMLDLIHRCYPNGGASLSHVVMEEVAPGTGWYGGQRWADALVLGMWPSKGLTLDGYEVKASKADLKRELADPQKHRVLARFCDHWWLVVWDAEVLIDGVPDDWGVMVTEKGDDGERALKVLKEAADRTPEPWPRTFTCSLVRNAHEQSPGAAYVARACVEARRRGQHEGRSDARTEIAEALEPLRKLLFDPHRRWEWPSDPETIIEAAVERLTQGVLGEPTP